MVTLVYRIPLHRTGKAIQFLCRLRIIAAHRDHFVQRLSVCLSVHNFVVVTHSYASQATHAFLPMLPLCLLQAVLLHYIAKIHANIHWDLNFLTPSIEPEHVFQYCTHNIAALRRHIQFYYKSIAFYSAYVYRIEKYRIAAQIFNTYRIVRHAYRYTPNAENNICISILLHVV